MRERPARAFQYLHLLSFRNSFFEETPIFFWILRLTENLSRKLQQKKIGIPPEKQSLESNLAGCMVDKVEAE